MFMYFRYTEQRTLTHTHRVREKLGSVRALLVTSSDDEVLLLFPSRRKSHFNSGGIWFIRHLAHSWQAPPPPPNISIAHPNQWCNTQNIMKLMCFKCGVAEFEPIYNDNNTSTTPHTTITHAVLCV